MAFSCMLKQSARFTTNHPGSRFTAALSPVAAIGLLLHRHSVACAAGRGLASRSSRPGRCRCGCRPTRAPPTSPGCVKFPRAGRRIKGRWDCRCVVFDRRLLHAGSANCGADTERKVIFLGYGCESWPQTSSALVLVACTPHNFSRRPPAFSPAAACLELPLSRPAPSQWYVSSSSVRR